MAGEIDAVDLLAVENLEVVYNDVALTLKGLSLRAGQGGITALLGAPKVKDIRGFSDFGFS